MVVSESVQADVVFVMETTANFAPYAEMIKSYYLTPILEYFTGGPADDRDIGCDNNFCCSLFAAIYYNTASHVPDMASSCYGPAASSFKLLQLLEKMVFKGGGSEQLSHVTEGMATALQCFDDLQEMRDSVTSGVKNSVQKHCILFCNSPPYDLPTVESITYPGMMLDELVAIMAKRDIKLTVISPRKMSFLFKLFERAGGDLQSALSRKYAKDRRHMVLLAEGNGFALQERPDSPVHAPPQSSNSSSLQQPPTPLSVQPSTPQGIKRPTSPTVSTTTTRPNSTGPVTSLGNTVSSQPQGNQIRAPPPPSSSFPAVRAGSRSPLTVRGQSPQQQQLQPQPNVQQPTPSVLTARLMTSQPSAAPMNQGSVTAAPVPRMQAPRPPTAAQIRAQQQQQQQQTQQTGFQSQVPSGGMTRVSGPRMSLPIQSMQPQQPMQQPQMQLQGQPIQQQLQGQTMMPINTQMTSQSQVVTNVPQGVQMQSMTPGREQLQTMLMQQPQQQPQQQMTMPQSQILVGQQQQQQQRTIVWTGSMVFEEKLVAPTPNQPPIKTPHTLPCQISCFTSPTGAPEANVQGWPNQLNIQLLPRQMVMKMTSLRNESIHVGIHFQEENITPENKPALEKLTRVMSVISAGCVQFNVPSPPGQPASLRIMIIIYFEDKKAFYGFIPNEQEKFFSQLKQMVTEQKRQQQLQQQQQQQQQNPGMRMTNPLPVTRGPVPVQQNPMTLTQQQPIQQQPTQQQPPMMPQTVNIRQQGSNTTQFFQPNPQQTGQMMPQGQQLQMASQPMQVQPQQNVLLNQALGPVTSQQQQSNAVQIVNVTIQPQGVNPIPGQQTFQIMGQGQMPGQIHGQIQGTQIQVNPQGTVGQMVSGQPQPMNPGTQQIVAQLQAHQQQQQVLQQQGQHDDRTENSIQIKKLQEMLAAAQQKERQYQMSDQPTNPMMSTGPTPVVQQQQPQPPTQQPLVRQQLQQHIQSNQQQQRLQSLQNQQQQVAGVTGNPQLRHLLQQQQQIRGGPNQMQQQHMMMQPGMRMQQQPQQQQPGQQQMQGHLTPQQMQALQMRQQQQQQQQPWDGSNMDMM